MLTAKKPKTAVYTLIAVVLIAALAVGCTSTEQKNESEPDADLALFDCDGLTVAIPNEYMDRLLVYDGLDENELIRVYEKQSYEESYVDLGESAGLGFLFAIVRYNQAEYERYLCSHESGLSFIAKDDNYYYGRIFPTDVQFYRSGVDTYTEEMLAPWNKLVSEMKGIVDDFVSRNKLPAYSDYEFWDRAFTYDSEHLYITYYPYYTRQETAAMQGFSWEDVAYTLVLSQPATQDETGIWCVERWYSNNDYDEQTYYYFPAWNNQTDLTAADYYAQLQTECDAGHRLELLDPMQVAMEFIMTYFEDTPTAENLVLSD